LDLSTLLLVRFDTLVNIYNKMSVGVRKEI